MVFTIDTSRIANPAETIIPTETVSEIEKAAEEQVQEFERTVAALETAGETALPTEIQQLVKTYPIKDVFKEQAEKINLPQFYLKVPASQFNFSNDEEYSSEPLEKEDLLKGFELSKSDINIAFDSITSELYRVDLDETKKEHTPTFVRLDGQIKKSIMAYILDPARKASRVKNISSRIIDMLGKMDPIPQGEVNKYVKRIIEGFDDERFSDFAANEYTYIRKIKDKINEHPEGFAERKFKDFLDTDKVFINPSFKLPRSIAPGETGKNIPKSLYEKEGKMNSFEERIINEIGNMQNVAFWTRNTSRTGFRINGFINHYPDFIIYTKSGKTVVLETKGDHLDAEQKIRLGNLWASKAGNHYRYFIVYERRTVDGAYRLEDFLNIIKEI